MRIGRLGLALGLLLGFASDAGAVKPNALVGAFGHGLPSLSFVACTSDTSNATIYTFGGASVGTANANRTTIVGILSQDAASVFGVDSVTVGGASATEIADEGGTNVRDAAVYALANPAGATEDIVVTFSEATGSATICVWSALNLNSSTTPVDTATDNSNGAAMTLSVDTNAFGVSVGVCTTSSSEAFSWTGLSEADDTSNGESTTTAADFTENASAASPLSVTCDPTGSGASAGAAASFR